MTGNLIYRFSGSYNFRLVLRHLILLAAVSFTVSAVNAQTGNHIDVPPNNLAYPINWLNFNNIYTAGNGGAINALNSDVTITNSNFTNNTAAGLGGAIYFSVEGITCTLSLAVTEGNQSVFSGNKQNSSQNNSIVFAGKNSSNVYLYIDTEENTNTSEKSVLRQENPMTVDPNSTDFSLSVYKYGSGTWELGGISNFNSANESYFGVGEGTLQFIGTGTDNNAGVKLYAPGSDNYFYTASGTNLAVAQGVNTVIDANGFYTENGSNVYLLGNMDLSADYIQFAGNLSGSGNLTVRAAENTNGGILYFTGNTSGYSGDLTVRQGITAYAMTRNLTSQGGKIRLLGNLNLYAYQNGSGTEFGGVLTGNGNITVNRDWYADPAAGNGILHIVGETSDYTGSLAIGSNTTLALDTDKTFTTAGTVSFADDSALSIKTGKLSPLMKASSIAIGNNVNLILNGVYQNTTQPYIVLESGNVISGVFANEGSNLSIVDYLSTGLEKSGDGRQYLLTNTLTWNFTDGNAHGTFTVEENSAAGVPGKFTVETSLNPNYTSNTGWDGQTLTKKGTGILELAAKNNIGNAIIEDGVLQLSHSEALDNSRKVLFQPNSANAKPVLELDFQNTITGSEYRFRTQVGDNDGTGTLVKKGSNTVLLMNTNNQYGDTEIKEGVLALENNSVLGSGKVLFTGGTLQYRNTAADFGYELAAIPQNNIQLDTQKDMRLTGNITGSGGLIKTGNAKLTLTGIASYTGNTEIKEGTLALDKQESIGNGSIIVDDGAVFQNTTTAKTGTNGLARNFVLNTSSNGQVVNGSTIDTKEDLQILSTISGDGMLVKKSEGKTLTLSATNTYSGGTRLDEGTVSISKPENLGTGNVIFNGGTLKNTAVIGNFNRNVTVNRNKNAIFDTEENLTINGGTISGSGGLIKTGDAELTLSGNHSYTGDTLVESGTLAVNGKIYSDTTVKSGAILRGKGTITGNVNFENGSAYEWYAGHTFYEKDCLTVLGDVNLNNTTFIAVTAGGDPKYFEYDLNGQEVLKYSELTGDRRFAAIDNSESPFYIFSLDYSESGIVRVLAHKRSEALALSDGVAVGLNTAQRRAHRRPFDHIDFSFRNARYALPETLNGTLLRKYQQIMETGGYRGQNTPKTHNIWGDIYIRGTQYDSTFFANDWKMCSVGFQGGYSFYADQNLEWGLTVGAESPELKNSGDKITVSDGYLGLYYGQRLQRNWELKGYIGSGTQRYESDRYDAVYKYHTRYYGESFQTNIELARPLRTPYCVLRPLFGFDFEYAQQEAAYENCPALFAEQRYYSKASLTQLFAKVGLDFQRPLKYGDAYFGISYSNMIAGDSTPVVGVYYPGAGMKGTIRAASLGQNIFTFRLGANHYLNGRNYSILYWNFTADEYADRSGGKGEFTGTVGYSYRF